MREQVCAREAVGPDLSLASRGRKRRRKYRGKKRKWSSRAWRQRSKNHKAR